MEKYRITRGAAAAAVPSLLLGTAAGVALSAALLALTALVFVKLETPPVAAAPYVTAAAGACGAYLAGRLTLKLFGSRGLLMGALAGLLMFCCVLAAGGAAGSVSLAPALVRCAVFAVCGSVGGVMQVNRRVKVKV